MIEKLLLQNKRRVKETIWKTLELKKEPKESIHLSFSYSCLTSYRYKAKTIKTHLPSRNKEIFLTHYIFPVSNRSYGRINVFIDLEVFIFKQYQVIARSTPFPKHSMKSVQVKISINPVISVCEYIYTLSVCVCLVLQKRQEGAKKRADNFFLKIMWNLYLWTLSLLCEV